ncbi:MAG TPA: hypothetical protein VNL18_15635 [Gemmatimonadales bacterium]|nr:hypothetical protein [Gemmatimonadales bacterium]
MHKRKRLTVTLLLDELCDYYSRITDEWTRPTTKAGMVARLEGIATNMEQTLQYAGRDPRKYLLPRTAEALAAIRREAERVSMSRAREEHR